MENQNPNQEEEKIDFYKEKHKQGEMIIAVKQLKFVLPLKVN